MTVKDWLNKNKISYKVSGQEAEIGCLFKGCPNHGQNQMYINLETEAWICHRCNEKGRTLKQLEYKLGMLEEAPTETAWVSERELISFSRSLLGHRQALDYLTVQRGLTPGIIKQFRLGLTHEAGHEVITIPSFNLDNHCVGMDYHYFKGNANSKYTRLKGSKVVAYNLNMVNFDLPIFITEGRYDCMSLFQYGITNVVSMPNGGKNLGDWVEELREANEFYLCCDNDPVGNEAATKLAKILGRTNCYRVLPPVGKDFNECLQYGVEREKIEQTIEKAEAMFDPPSTIVSDYVEDAKAFLDNPDMCKGVTSGWKVVDNFLGGVREGELTVLSGLTGNGKTRFSLALIGNLIKNGMKSLVVSPEMTETDILIILAKNFFSRNVKGKDIESFAEKAGDMVRLAKTYNNWTKGSREELRDLTFDLIDYLARHEDLKFVFIDHLRLFVDSGDNERKDIDLMMQKCIDVAARTGVHIFLVVQPRKLNKDQRKVTMGDLKGSSSIEQDAHNILLIHKDKNDLVEFDLQKNRRLGTTGTFFLQFDLESQANYYEKEIK